MFCEYSHVSVCCQNFNKIVCHKFATELMTHLVGRQDWLTKRISFQQGDVGKKKKITCNSSTFTLIFSEFKQANKQNFELQFLEFLKIDIFFFNIPSCFLVWVWVVFPSPETCLEGKSNGTASHLKSGKQICFWHFQFLKYFCSS